MKAGLALLAALVAALGVLAALVAVNLDEPAPAPQSTAVRVWEQPTPAPLIEPSPGAWCGAACRNGRVIRGLRPMRDVPATTVVTVPTSPDAHPSTSVSSAHPVR